MSAPVVHAIDGGIFRHALCEEPTGDTTDRERDVSCSDCLDIVEGPGSDGPDPAVIERLRAAGWETS